MSSTSPSKLFEADKIKNRSQGGILLQSRTVVEKKDFVSTGILSYAEGDIIEIEMSEFKAFELGDKVKLTVYSPGGIYVFESTIVAKDHGALMVINPPHNQSRFAEKREHPRVKVNQSGVIVSIKEAEGIERLLQSKVELTVQNLSISGLGFTVLEYMDLDTNSTVSLALDLGFTLQCTTEIIRSETTVEGYYYGARYVDLTPEKANSLRAFILKMQVESHYTLKKEEMQKSNFK
ncbi:MULTISPECIES: PilZ domain-containing protein [unclassified Paenibacillus]|uniref:PilZ domain-containing protein n=1 Tax=unclassified Paenibacillus TaxID=185978 RepID=UPI001AE2D2F1|nr:MULTISPECIES: PilZ domain-containing protein [unclassified Paenibacillus]MBP1153225.1 c-di-GMP-binding flagellar brake protein YcgR [Paenibacillus sp. PvP091]MBP1171392.1 c-di-GMP-binding flagellar brake protein YcgR [Paenibacillus sp. PvR098]MBP2442420.1 c-di-GMP-binding flagellar brake protein YcgR [Paenibacillus sp. PvP052]